MERSFSMRKKKPVFPKVFFTFLLISVFLGYLFYSGNTKNEPETDNKAVDVRSEPVLTENSVTRIKTLYKCGHEKNETKRTDSNLAGKTRREIELIHPDWIMTSFTPDEIMVEIEEKNDCDRHYMIRLIGNKLCVYKTSDPNKILKEKEININAFSQTDIEILLNGIRAETEFEMLEILESFAE